MLIPLPFVVTSFTRLFCHTTLRYTHRTFVRWTTSFVYRFYGAGWWLYAHYVCFYRCYVCSRVVILFTDTRDFIGYHVYLRSLRLLRYGAFTTFDSHTLIAIHVVTVRLPISRYVPIRCSYDVGRYRCCVVTIYITDFTWADYGVLRCC